jgi:ring-1,2-phenylacetyl-CoA epoxidase subunit PaaC
VIHQPTEEATEQQQVPYRVSPLPPGGSGAGGEGSPRAALARYLLSVADDELVIAYRDTEWTGVGPVLEEDIAFSSIGQDEAGHARLFFSLRDDLLNTRADYFARRPDEYLHAQFVEHPSAPRYDPAALAGGGDWAYALVRQYLYDSFDAVRLESLAGSSYAPLALAVDKVRREETYHLQHTQTWMARLAAGSAEARGRLERALHRSWPDALGLFEPVAGEDVLVQEGVLPASSATLRDRWLDRIAPLLDSHGLAMPARRGADGAWQLAIAPRLGGRRGAHTPAWRQLWDDMTSVYRLDPAATW